MTNFATTAKWEARDASVIGPYRKLHRGKAHVWALTERQDRTDDLCEVNQLIGAGIISADAHEYRGFNNGTHAPDYLSLNENDWPQAHWHHYSIEGKAGNLLANGAPCDLIFADYCTYRGTFWHDRVKTAIPTKREAAKSRNWGSLTHLLDAINESQASAPYVAVNLCTHARALSKDEDALSRDIDRMLDTKAGEGWAVMDESFYYYQSLSSLMTTFWLARENA